MMRRSLPSVIAASVLAIILAACGMQPTPLPTPPPTRLPPTVFATAIATPQPTPLPAVTPTPHSSPTPTPFPLSVRGATTCGGIEIRDGVFVDPVTTANVEECFWQAYQTCDVTKDLGVVQTSITTPDYSGRTYTLRSPGSLGNPGGRCAVQVSTGTVQVIRDPTTGAMAAATGSRPYTGDFCRGMARDSLGDLLFIGCGDGQRWDLMAP